MPTARRLLPRLLSVGVLLFAADVARAAGPPPARTRPAQLFGMTHLWEMHLTVSAADWPKMQPTRGGFPGMGGFGQPAAKPLGEGRVIRGNFGFDFEYVKADLVINGVTYKNVSVRFKGSGTYAMSQRHLKRPFKIDLDRHVANQSVHGVTKLVLNNNVMDGTAVREALAYGVYRAAGLATPRTAYAVVRLSVPGKYDKELLGVYTLAESVDRAFLKDRFGSDKGLLLKPERVGPLDHLGGKWDDYDARYRPKTKASEAAKKKLIALTHLVQYADDDRFRKEIGRYVDIDNFLRYTAASALLSNVDSFMGLAHNYYLYLHPKTDRFVLIPWDTDLAFSGLMLGSAADLMDLSIRQPQMGRNALVQRLLAEERHFAAYKGHIRRLLKSGFTEEGIKRDMATITRVIGADREREKKASAARKEPPASFGAWMPKQPDVLPFVQKRIASVRAQLDGKAPGKPMQAMWGAAAGPTALVRAILKAADKDDDKHLSRAEVADALKAILKKIDASKGPLDENALVARLDTFVPRPPSPWAAFIKEKKADKPKEKGKEKAKSKPPALPPGSYAVDFARSLLERGGEAGKVSEKRALAAADKLFTKHDANKDGKLSEKELSAAVQELLPSPAFVMPAVERPAPAKPAARKEGKK